MKLHRFSFIATSLFCFTCISQLVGCNQNKPLPAECKVTLTTSTLNIDKTVATGGVDFLAHLSLKDKVSPLLSLPQVIQVSIDGKTVGLDQYSYLPEGQDPGLLKIPANNLRGDIVITAEADNTIADVGDYLHTYVKDSVSFKVNLIANKHYFVSAVSENKSDLKIFYIAPNVETEAELLAPDFVAPITGNYTFIIRSSSLLNKPLNTYVTATIAEVISYYKPSDRFNLDAKLNEKIVAFAYRPTITISGPTHRIIPIIDEGAEFFEKTPSTLKDLLNNPIIFYQDKSQNYNRIEMIKRGNFYVAENSQTIEKDFDIIYYFFAYVNGIKPDQYPQVNIASGLKYNDIRIATINIPADTNIYVFVDNLTVEKTYIVNDYLHHRCDNIFDDNFSPITPIVGRNVFKATSSTVIFNYLITSKTDFKDFGCYEYENIINHQNFKLIANYANRSIVFGDVNNKNIVEAQIPENTDYTYIIDEDSQNSQSVIKSIKSYCSEANLAFTTSFNILFKQIATKDNHKIYAAINADNPGKTLYLKTSATSTSSINELLINFADKVTDKDSINISIRKINCLNLPVQDSFTIEEKDNVSFMASIPNVPYSCYIKPKPGFSIPLNSIKVKIGNDYVANVKYDPSTSVLSFITDKQGAMTFEINTVEITYDITVKSDIAKGPELQLDSYKLNKVHAKSFTASFKNDGEYIFPKDKIPHAEITLKSGGTISVGLTNYTVLSDNYHATFTLTPPAQVVEGSVLLTMPVIGIAHKIVYNNAATSKLSKDYVISVTESAVIDVVAKNNDYKFTGFLPHANDIVLEDSKFDKIYATSVDLTPDKKGVRITFDPISVYAEAFKGDLALTNLDTYFLENNASTLQLDNCDGICHIVGGVQYLSAIFERTIEIEASDTYFIIDEQNPNIDDFVYTCGDTKLTPTSVNRYGDSLVIVCPKINTHELGKNFRFDTALIKKHFAQSVKFSNIHLVANSIIKIKHSETDFDLNFGDCLNWKGRTVTLYIDPKSDAKFKLQREVEIIFSTVVYKYGLIKAADNMKIPYTSPTGISYRIPYDGYTEKEIIFEFWLGLTPNTPIDFVAAGVELDFSDMLVK